MQTRETTIRVLLKSTPSQIYSSWLNSEIHGKIIGGIAKIDPTIGGKFSLWDNAIIGRTIELDPTHYKIVQEWRDNSSDWPDDYFSKICVTIDKKDTQQSELTIHHTGIPAVHFRSIKDGWQNFYVKPMKKYFSTG